MSKELWRRFDAGEQLTAEEAVKLDRWAADQLTEAQQELEAETARLEQQVQTWRAVSDRAYAEMRRTEPDDAEPWAGHPDTPVSDDELAALIAQDYSGGKWAWR